MLSPALTAEPTEKGLPERNLDHDYEQEHEHKLKANAQPAYAKASAWQAPTCRAGAKAKEERLMQKAWLEIRCSAFGVRRSMFSPTSRTHIGSVVRIVACGC